jgi:hypothetical protein
MERASLPIYPGPSTGFHPKTTFRQARWQAASFPVKTFLSPVPLG